MMGYSSKNILLDIRPMPKRKFQDHYGVASYMLNTICLALRAGNHEHEFFMPIGTCKAGECTECLLSVSDHTEEECSMKLMEFLELVKVKFDEVN